jgi:hypothetical protein
MSTENKIPLPDQSDVQQTKPAFLQGDEWFDVNVDEDFLNFDEPYRPPRYTMERQGIPFADVGEMHIISGKPGNGKTGLMSQLEATTLGGHFGNTVCREIGHKLRDQEGFHVIPTKLLHIDTEQGKDDTIAFKNRVISMSGIAKDEAKAARLSTVLYNLLEATAKGAVLLTSFMPDTAEAILKEFGSPELSFDDLSAFGNYPSGTRVTAEPATLFMRLDENEIMKKVAAIEKAQREAAEKEE